MSNRTADQSNGVPGSNPGPDGGSGNVGGSRLGDWPLSPSASLFDRIEQLKAELSKYAYHNDAPLFPEVWYCNYCHYSREWISTHGHGKDCLLRSFTDEALNQ